MKNKSPKKYFHQWWNRQYREDTALKKKKKKWVLDKLILPNNAHDGVHSAT